MKAIQCKSRFPINAFGNDRKRRLSDSLATESPDCRNKEMGNKGLMVQGSGTVICKCAVYFYMYTAHLAKRIIFYF